MWPHIDFLKIKIFFKISGWSWDWNGLENKLGRDYIHTRSQPDMVAV